MNDSPSTTTMKVDNSEFLASMEKVREAVGKSMESVKAIGESLSGLGEKFASLPGVEAFAEGIKDAMEQGRQFADQAKQTGQSVSTMVELKQAFESAGVSGENVTGALAELNKAMDGVGEKGKPASDAFAKLGLSIGNLKKMNGVEQFQAIIKGLDGLPDSASRAAAAQQIFGEKSREIMGVLNDPKGFNAAIQGSAAYGRTMQDNAGSFEKVGQAAQEIQTKIKACYAAIAGGLAPALQGMLELVQKIDLPEVGANLGRGIAFAFEAFKEGKVFEMIRLSLTIAFKEAVNSLYRGLLGAGAALQVVLANVPKLLTDAFSLLTNASFWEGIGKLLLGAFKSIQGELTKIFFSLADALGNRLADLLDKIPMLRDLAEQLRTAMNKGNAVVQTLVAKSQTDAKQETDSGTAMVNAATKQVVGDATDIGQQAKTAAQTAVQQSQPLLDDAPDEAKNDSIKRGLVTNLLKTNLANAADTAPLPDKNTPSNVTLDAAGSDKDKKKPKEKAAPLDHFKTPDVDRWAKVGIFIGCAPQAPGLSEARRTATATEKMVKSFDLLIAATRSNSSTTGMVYSE